MSFRASILFALCACAVALPRMEFSIEEVEKIPKQMKTRDDLIDFITERKYVDTNRNVKLTNFAFRDCGGPKALVHIKSVTIGPDPVVLPGPMKISAAITVTKTLDSPLMGNVTAEKKVLSKWVKIPCIDSIGSCQYDDLCDLLYEVTCPDPLVKIGINCLCPLFKPQDYTLPMTQFDVNFGPLPKGDYHFIGSAMYKGAMGACIDLQMTFG